MNTDEHRWYAAKPVFGIADLRSSVFICGPFFFTTEVNDVAKA